jgi:predicted HD phosphohydrolase
MQRAITTIKKKESDTLEQSALVEELQETYSHGLQHPLCKVQRQFRESLAIAERARAEGAESTMIAAALLYRPCQMLFTGVFQSEAWNSDSLIESGAYDWICENFGGEVADTIRLQPHARRYLAATVGHYYKEMGEQDRNEILQNGGIMTSNACRAFARGRYFTQSLRLARWINQMNQVDVNSMDMRQLDRMVSRILPLLSRSTIRI